MLTLLIISLSLIAFSLLLFKFITAEGDFTLTSNKHLKREEIEDKGVWITGANGGIGEVLAKQLASLGPRLSLSAGIKLNYYELEMSLKENMRLNKLRFCHLIWLLEKNLSNKQ